MEHLNQQHNAMLQHLQSEQVQRNSQMSNLSLKLEKYAADIDKIIQEPSMKQINGSAQPHKNKINLIK